MDAPQRANAAQLAARNIKAKPKGRTGRTVTGSRPDSVPQFAQPSQNGGGMFGGGIQGSGSFDFSAPGGMNFAAPSFGSNATPSPDVSDNEGRFPGDDRAMKRQFGGSSTMQHNQPAIQQSGPFGQSSVNPFGTSSAQAAPGGNIFSFGSSSGPTMSNNFNGGNVPASNPFSFGGISQPAPASPSISFGSGPAESKPANSPFQFGQQATQPQSFNSPFNFNSSASQEKPATPQPQTSTPVFNFGSTAQQNTSQPQAPKSPFTFGSTTAQEKPGAAPFLFGQNPAPPSSSGMNFGSQPVTAPPLSNLFGTSISQPAPTPNIFGPPAPTTNSFGSTSIAPPSMNNLFGSREQSPAPTGNNLFGGPSANSPSTSGPPPTPNLFGEQKSSAANNIFGGLNKPSSTANVFGSPVKTSTPANNLFGKANSEQSGTKDLFGTLNKPVDESVKQHKANSSFGDGSNGDASATSKAESNSPFKKRPAPSLFGQSSPSNNTNNGPTNGARSQKPSTSTSSSLQHTPNISSPLKDAPMAASQPPPSGMFPNLPQPSKSLQQATQPSVQVNFLGTSFPLPADHPALASGPDPFNITDEQIAKVLPGDLKDDPQVKANWITKYRIDAMNQAMSAMFEALPADVNPRPTLLRYIKLRGKLVEEHNARQEQFSQSGTNRSDSANDTATNPFRITGSATPGQTSSKRKLAEDEDQENENPSKRTKEQSTHGQRPAASEPKPQANGIGGSAASKALQETSSFKPAALSQNGNPSSNLTTPSPMKNKRKAESQISKDTEEASPLRQIKTPRLNGGTVGSNTSNIFKNILDSPSPSKSSSPTKFNPEKKTAPLPEPKEDTPRINPFGKLPVPASPTKSTSSPAPSAPSTTFTPKAAPASSSLFAPVSTPGAKTTFTPKKSTTAGLFGATIPAAESNLFAPKVAGAPVNPFSPKPTAGATNDNAPAAKESTLKPPTFSTGPVDFLAQFGKKASEDKEDNEKKLLQKAIDEDYDSDDGDLEEFKANYHEKRKAELKALEDLAKNTRNAFIPKSDGVDSGKSSSKSLTPEPANKVATSKPFFGQNNANQGSGNSVFSSLNVSRTPTPGPLGSSTGSVLDGHASTKPISFSGNIFGHLSDADSGKGNDADDESADEDTDGDEENRDPNYQPGDDASGPGTPASETGDGIASAKKTNFFSNYGTPKANPFGSGSSTPGGGLFGRVGSKELATEKEQSGTSTPGRSLFDRIASKDTSTEKEQGGTTTPGGSLFDRITKDSNGNPVRHISTEEKENTQPSTSNIFKDASSPFSNPFNKTPGAPADQTWKPDSPIRFGAAADTETSTSAPTVSITAATPTKTGNPSNLFGGPTSAPASSLFGSKDSKPALSNLFGSSSSAKGPASANVGFGFGAPSATSSLFPSAAGSANTSRATSPGVTTDADSGVDGDPDAEVHEQINLTSGGPGEENEEVLFEVRAKALMFTTTAEEGSKWTTKGLGPLRVLQDKDTKAVRMLLRADPLGTVVLNKALLSQVTYEAAAKTVKLLANADDGKGLETWLLQVKTVEIAKDLAAVLEKNKSS
ncbi:hypothetical protein DL98DRAFT_519470 [Cadophora sp. DSE1049]|nr:hypothetical protein DL98DRAFT_519470 [Cadophora sp. DSE1049]